MTCGDDPISLLWGRLHWTPRSINLEALRKREPSALKVELIRLTPIYTAGLHHGFFLFFLQIFRNNRHCTGGVDCNVFHLLPIDLQCITMKIYDHCVQFIIPLHSDPDPWTGNSQCHRWHEWRPRQHRTGWTKPVYARWHCQNGRKRLYMPFDLPILTHKPGLRYTVGTMPYQLQPPTPGVTQYLNQSSLNITRGLCRCQFRMQRLLHLVLDSM